MVKDISLPMFLLMSTTTTCQLTYGQGTMGSGIVGGQSIVVFLDVPIECQKSLIGIE